MKALKIALIMAGFVAGFVGASVALADTTNGNTNTGGGTVTNISWGQLKCLYGPNPSKCAGTPKQVLEDPDSKTSG
jgi:hypothetical protein